MNRSLLLLLTALTLTAGCATSVADTRPLTDAERQALIREQQAKQLKQRASGNQRAGCAQSSSASRLNARQNSFQGPDSFDSRGCLEDPPPGPGLTSPASPR